MTESAWPLRIALLLLGLLVIAAVYGWGIWRRRQSRRAFTRRLGGLHRAPRGRRDGRAFEPEFEPELESDPAAAAPPDEDDFVIIPVKPRERLDDLPVITREHEPPRGMPPAPEPGPASQARAARPPRPRRKKDQLSLALDADEPPSPAPLAPEVLALFLRPVGTTTFAGPALLEATATLGMHYGDMRVFHHFGTADLRTSAPLFSLANMFEPGYFDLERMDDFTTGGLALFMKLPADLDGPVAFELFLNAAQRLATALAGELRSDPETALDGATIDRMRHLAARYVHARP